MAGDTRRLNVLSVIEVLGRGGAETALVDLVVGLPQHRHSVWHFSRSNGVAVDSTNLRRLHAAGAIVKDVHWRTVVDPYERDRELSGFRPDVVIFHWWQNEPWLPWVDSARDNTHRPGFLCVLHTARVSVSAAYDAYVFLADLQRSGVPNLAPGPARLIPNAVDLARFSARSRASRLVDGGPFVIGVLSALRPFKVPHTLVADAARWAVPGSIWRVCGDGQLRGSLEEEASLLAPAAAFTFAGHISRSDVPRFLSGLDVLCHVVHPETLDCNPIAVLEALAAGVPVVAERRGGLPELIEHGVNGLLADDPEEVGHLLRKLAGDRALVRKLAAGARKSAARHDRGRQLSAYAELIDSLARPTRQAPQLATAPGEAA